MEDSLTNFLDALPAPAGERTVAADGIHAGSPPGFLEKAYSTFVLVLTTGAVVGMIGQSPSNLDAEGQGNSNVLWLRTTWLIVYSLAILFLFAHRKVAWRALAANKFLAVLFVLPILSVSWSYAPAASFKQGLVMFGTCLFGLYFGVRYSIPDQLVLLSRALIFVTALSLLAVVFLPDYGVSHGVHFGNWRGVFPHKNVFGRYMALNVFVSLTALRCAGQCSVKRARMWLAISVLLLFLSGSKSAIAVTAVVLVSMPLMKILRRSVGQLLGMGVGALALTLLAAPFILRETMLLLKLLGRDVTMSGRIYIWMGVGFRILQRPWLGYGFQGFWNSDLVRQIWILIHWTPGHAHDGYLQLCLDLGIAGLAVFFAGFAVAAARARALFLQQPKSIESVWSLVFLTLILVYSVPECCLLTQNSLYWVIYIGVATGLPNVRKNDDGHLALKGCAE